MLLFCSKKTKLREKWPTSSQTIKKLDIYCTNATYYPDRHAKSNLTIANIFEKRKPVNPKSLVKTEIWRFLIQLIIIKSFAIKSTLFVGESLFWGIGSNTWNYVPHYFVVKTFWAWNHNISFCCFTGHSLIEDKHVEFRICVTTHPHPNINVTWPGTWSPQKLLTLC